MLSMNPEQTDPIVNGSSLIYCLQYWLPKAHKQKRKRTTIVVNSEKNVNFQKIDSNMPD